VSGEAAGGGFGGRLALRDQRPSEAPWHMRENLEERQNKRELQQNKVEEKQKKREAGQKEEVLKKKHGTLS